MPLVAYPLAVLIGLSLGLLGGGGSILTIPVLVYAVGLGAKEAIAMGLAIVGATSLAGAGSHLKRGNLDLRTALLFGGIGGVGTYAGARLSVFLSGAVQLSLVAGVMLTAAVSMLRTSQPIPISSDEHKTAALAPLTAAALGVGLLPGVAGVGGGFLIVPALTLLTGLPIKRAIGTSLLVIALNSLVGFLGYWGQVEIRWGFLTLFCILSVTGMAIGSALSHRVSSVALKKGFALFLLVMGVFILFKNRELLLQTVAHLRYARALLGGGLIGGSAALLLLLEGRIAGISGIAGGLLNGARGDRGWRIAFLLGLVAGGLLLRVFFPGSFGVPVGLPIGLTLLAGLLVGFGARPGNGCTSGHGICGVGRGSVRSLVGTSVFILTGAATVFVTRHLMGGFR